jgi:hypothetical protein
LGLAYKRDIKTGEERIFFIKPTFRIMYWFLVSSSFHHLGNQVTVNKGIDVISNEKMQLLQTALGVLFIPEYGCT